jgi:hypothetical protein
VTGTVGSRTALAAFNRQVRQLPEDLQRRECGLIAIGRQHARDFDCGHSPSGGRVQRVLTELRKLAERTTSLRSPPQPAEMPGASLTQSELAALIGSQTPRIESVPPAVTSAGQEAIEAGCAAGRALASAAV